MKNKQNATATKSPSAIQKINLGGSSTDATKTPTRNDFSNNFSTNYSQGKSTTTDNTNTGVDAIADNTRRQLDAIEEQNKILREILGTSKVHVEVSKDLNKKTQKVLKATETNNTNNIFTGNQSSDTTQMSIPPSIESVMSAGWKVS
jgi:chorismate mutase